MLDIEALPAMVDSQVAAVGSALLFEATGTNVASVFVASLGDADAAFARADYVLRDQFQTQRQTAMPMETRGLVAEWDAGRLTISGAAKLPFFNRRSMAAMMKLPEDRVDYIELDVGGGFGARGEFYPEDFLLGFAARRFGHPVKWIEDRREHFLATGHARESCLRSRIRVPARRHAAGRARHALRQHRRLCAAERHDPGPQHGAIPLRSLSHPEHPFRGPCGGDQQERRPAHLSRPGPLRSRACSASRCWTLPQASLASIAWRSAAAIFLTQAEMPYQLASQSHRATGWPRLPATAATIASRSTAASPSPNGLLEKAHLQGRSDRRTLPRARDWKFHRGRRIGTCRRMRGSMSRPMASYRCMQARRQSGRGSETVLAQIAADTLEIPLGKRIKVFHGSTTYLGEGWGSYGSRATVMGGSAVVAAAHGLLAMFRVAAAKKLGVPPSELVIANGRRKCAGWPVRHAG